MYSNSKNRNIVYFRQVNTMDNYRSTCPINFLLEMIGDSWSLLILRDIVYFGKKTYGEFVSSDEKIARNILAARLKRLQDEGILAKTPHPGDKRKDIYSLTEKGLKLIPLLMDAADWGAEFAPSTDAPMWWVEKVRADRERVLPVIYDTVREGGAVFVGENSVIEKLGLLSADMPAAIQAMQSS